MLLATVGPASRSRGHGPQNAPPDKTEGQVDYARDIRPILSNHCYECHGPDSGHREGGDPSQGGLRFDQQASAFQDLGGYRAIVPGKPEESELIRRIFSTDEDEVMPPADHPKQLTAKQRDQLKQWVNQGATWSEHWAYSRPQRTTPPRTSDTTWSQNWIDEFILARLEEKGFKPTRTADRRTLLRRVTLDLTGMPPTIEALNAFEQDRSPDAFERVVERLLNSPQFGERLAIYWLDLVRYADTVGYHGDQPVSISPYRDYVIRAFNDNMPFDQFTREQLAGDLLADPNLWQQVASGYNRLGMMSAEGGVQPEEYLAKYAADRVRNASSVWLGSTLACAECHDHKFDPFTTRDFYQFASFFADIKERGLYSGAHASGQWGPNIAVPDDDLQDLLAPLEQQILALEEQLSTPSVALADGQQKWEAAYRQRERHWHIARPESLAADQQVEFKVLEDGSVRVGGPNPESNTYRVRVKALEKPLTAIRLEVLPDHTLPKNGPGRAGNGNLVITEVKVRSLPASADSGIRSWQAASATIEQTVAGESHPDKKWSAQSAIDQDQRGAQWGWAILPRAGQVSVWVGHLQDSSDPQGADKLASDKLASDKPQPDMLEIEIQQNHGTRHTLGRFRISLCDEPNPPAAVAGEQVPANLHATLMNPSQRTPAQATELAEYYRTIAPELAPARKELAEWKQRRNQQIQANTRSTLVTESVTPREMRVLPRGNWMDKSGPVVTPQVPEFLGTLSASERLTREDLANWLVSEDNPLTARVFVNRLWKLLFGAGLSRILDDFGMQGEFPTHPQLLDNLACEFMEKGWDVKHMVRLIVTSAAYQQSSVGSPELTAQDPYNRWLGRQSRYRLDAEVIRDVALAVSGLLVEEIGGRSVKPYQPPGLYQHLNFPKRTYQADAGKNQYRRGVYTHWQRQFLHPAMKAFDAPSREECTAQRPRSNTPLAALVLLNDPSYVESARMLAQRVLLLTPDSGDETIASRIDTMMQWALARPASSAEIQVLTQLLNEQQDYYANHLDEAQALVKVGDTPAAKQLNPSELAAWTSLARAIMNVHEFIVRN